MCLSEKYFAGDIQNRRGVLLLVVLSMLTLFLLLGVTFIVLASRARTVSKAYLQLADQQQQSAETLRPMVREAALQVIRGTRKQSALKNHDLLGDRYPPSSPDDNNTVLGVTAVADYQLIELELDQPVSTQSTGCVLGFVTGKKLPLEQSLPAVVQNIATRIVDVDAGNKTVTIPWPEGLVPGQEDRLRQKKVRINGRDFSGTGTGSNKHRPNWALPGGELLSPPVGMHEDYDAIDQDNAALAEVDLSISSYDSRKSINYWLDWYANQFSPALTRNAAEDAVYKLLSSNPLSLSGVQLQIVKEIRRASSRPFAYDHVFVPGEDFSGKSFSNARTFFSLLRGEAGFDVDSDGDGLPDSIWVDFGREAFRLPDRTLVKPLVAVRCIDLGGRINLNTHGSLAHYQGNSPSVGDEILVNQNSNSLPEATDQPVGLGYGPADVRLDTVLSGSQISSVFQGRSEDVGLIQGNGITRRLRGVRGRYGGGSKTPGSNDQNDRTWQDSIAGLLPSDYSSRYAIGLDRRGHPLFLNWDSSCNDAVDSPYELNLFKHNDCTPYDPLVPTTGAENDQPFTAAEMESLFRLRDADNASLLPQRLLAMFIDSDSEVLQLLTTASWDTPAIIGSVPTLTENSSNLEVKRGLKLNLNRPFGDGIDNDGDGAVDDPNETSDPYFASSGSGWRLTKGESIGTGTRQQPGPNVAGLRARQIMANNLFDLLLNLRNTAVLGDSAISKRELAQWAVNVVDFIDADAIMTPFRYDDGSVDQNVVWGCENSDLIITETLAFHDRAIADTDADDEAADENGSRSAAKTTAVSPDVPDADFDQIRVPQGSLFVELHATRNPLADSLPRELYSYNETKKIWQLELGKIPSGGSNPVWRLAFADLRTTGTTSNDPFLAIHEDTEYPLDPGHSTLGYSPQSGGIDVSRYAYFTNAASLANPDFANLRKPNKYNTFKSTSNRTLQCGGYLVAGPRSKTILGSTTAGIGQPSSQFIQISDSGVGKKDLDDSFASTASFPESSGCVLTAEGSTWSASRGHSIGLNISEPNGYEYYHEPSTSQPDPPYATPSYGPAYKDVPEDDHLLPALMSQGTHINASTVFLERLADPTRPYNPDATAINWNPYIIVDFAAIDLTVFNGETSASDPSVAAAAQPMYAHTRQRGFDAWLDQDLAGNNSELFSLSDTLDPNKVSVVTKYPWRPCSPYEKSGSSWVQRPPQPKVSGTNGTNAFFDYDVGASEDDTIPTHTLGWCNLSQGRRQNISADYNGVPESPFPWLAWKDGPLANPYELLMVPRTSASRLLTNYRDVGDLTDVDENYKDAADVLRPYGVDDDQPFGATRPGHHLLPLTSMTDRPLDPATPDTPVADALSKVFGYVRTPSPFAGTRTRMRTHKPNGDPIDDMPEHFEEPFNHIEMYREPGKINLNTVRDQRVWNALTGDTGIGLQPAWSDINNAFTGQGSPVRAAANGRSNTLLADGTSGVGIPLFPTPSNASQAAFDPGRSSWFRFAPLMRAAANSTARSEVYAIWVTVGLFEVEDVSQTVGQGIIDPDETEGALVYRYPESYKILREYGKSTGEVKRHRGFYIFDRSRSIVYEPGVNHNVDDGILVERFIQ